MKKIKKILLFIIMAILVAGILFAIAWQHPRFRDYYFREIDVWIGGPADISYQIWFASTGEEVQVTCDGKSFEVLPDEWYDGTPGFKYIKEEGGCWFVIDDIRDVTLNWTDMEKIGCGGRIWFPKGYCLGKIDMQMDFEDIHKIGICANEDNLVIDAEIKGDSWIYFYGGRSVTDTLVRKNGFDRMVRFGEAGIDLSNVHSLQFRKLEDGTPMAYLDLDGDGIYEYDCDQFTFQRFEVERIGEFASQNKIYRPRLLGIYSVAEAKEWVSSEEFRQQYGESTELNDKLALLEGDERIIVSYGSPISVAYNIVSKAPQEAYVRYQFEHTKDKIYFNAVYYDGKILESIE